MYKVTSHLLIILYVIVNSVFALKDTDRETLSSYNSDWYFSSNSSHLIISVRSSYVENIYDGGIYAFIGSTDSDVGVHEWKDGKDQTIEVPFDVNLQLSFSNGKFEFSDLSEFSSKIQHKISGKFLEISIKHNKISEIYFCGLIIDYTFDMIMGSTPSQGNTEDRIVTSYYEIPIGIVGDAKLIEEDIWEKRGTTGDISTTSDGTNGTTGTNGTGIYVPIEESEPQTAIIIGVVVGVGGVIMIGAILAVIFCKKKSNDESYADVHSTPASSGPSSGKNEVQLDLIPQKEPLPAFSVKGVGISFDQNSQFRKSMEDEHVFIDKFGGSNTQGYFAIFDGHGGREVAEYVSKNLHENILTEFKKCYEVFETASPVVHPTIANALTEAYLKTEEMIKSSGAGNPVGNHMPGSTACTAIVRKKKDGTRWLYLANVGDSRAVLCRGGTAVRLTYDHKASDQTEADRIRADGGWVVQNKVAGILAVARAFGNVELKQWVLSEPYISETELNANDTYLIIACDGLWDVISDQQSVDLILKEGKENPQVMSDLLLRFALENRSRDNVSIMVVQL